MGAEGDRPRCARAGVGTGSDMLASLPEWAPKPLFMDPVIKLYGRGLCSKGQRKFSFLFCCGPAVEDVLISRTG